MGRYRKIDPRIWHDERFADFDPLAKLAWLALLTHPCMTPMGAGMVYPGLIDSIISKADGETLLETFRDTSLIYRDKGLIIIKNYLLYNRPDNPNVLYSWIASCEELPRSDCFRQLHDHLQTAEPPLPSWIFAGLLKPLADKQNRTLVAQFWARVPPSKSGDKQVSREVPGNVSTKVHPNVSVNVPRNHPRNQEQEQEQEKKKIAASALPTTAGATPSQGKLRKIQLTDEEFISELKRSPAYAGINIDAELAKLDLWLKSPKGRGKYKTQSRVLSWLNRIERPMAPQNGHAGPGTVPGKCARRIKDGNLLRPCGRPVASGQEEPFCVECLEATRAERECLAHLGAMS